MTRRKSRAKQEVMRRRPGMALVVNALIDLGRLAYFKKHGHL